MKTTLLFFVTLISFIGNSQTGPSFSITNTSGTNYITCSNNSVNYVATSTANLTYLWVSSNATLSGSSVSFTVPGNYSVTATDTLNNSSVKMLSVLINTVLPISTVSPNIQSITCSSPTAQFVVVVSPTPGNPGSTLTHSITSQYGAPYVLNQNTSFIYQATAPGTYTYLIVDTNNGCSVVKHFTVNSSSGFPTYSITSPQNFTLGCSSKSVAIINIVNAQTTPVPGGAVSYSLIGPFGTISSYSINSPGIYTVVVKDLGTNCITQTPFSVLQNTTLPNFSVIVPTQTLNCNKPVVFLKAKSSTPNVSYFWAFMGVPNNPYDSLNVNINTFIPTNTLINTFTLYVTDTDNFCRSSTVIPMYQNIFKPNAAISSGGINALTCSIPTLMLTNVSTTGIPPGTSFPANAPVITNQWYGPGIDPPPFFPSSGYQVLVAGTYTLEVKDLNNGCTSQTVISIGDNQIYPQINLPSSYFVACPGTVTLSANVNGPPANFTYTWIASSQASLSSLNSANVVSNGPGHFTLTVTNIQNGCMTKTITVVQACVGLELATNSNNNYNFFPNPSNGPLTVILNKFIENTKIEIYNTLGVLIRTELLNSEKTTIDLNEASRGIYIIQIVENNKILFTSKFIKH